MNNFVSFHVTPECFLFFVFFSSWQQAIPLAVVVVLEIASLNYDLFPSILQYLQMSLVHLD